MNLNKILFPTDFSKLNNAALHYASRLAAESGARLYIVYVDDRSMLNASMGEAAYYYASQWDADELRKIREQLAQIWPTVAGVTFEHQCLEGSPVDELLGFAEREAVDLIVMGSHGRTDLSRLLMGSIAEGVVRRAKCPVLVVKQPVVDGGHVLTEDDLVIHK